MLGQRNPKRPSGDPFEHGAGQGEVPGQRALVAMAEAARRAREATNPSSLTGPEEGTPRVAAPATAPATPPHRGPEPAPEVHPPPESHPERRLVTAVVALVVVVLLAATGLAVVLATRGTSGPSPVDVGATSGHLATPPAHPGKTAHHPSTTTPAAHNSTPTSTVPAASPGVGGAPVLSALSPSTGMAGQSVDISGTNFISGDGVVQARFGGQLAPTACPVQTSCTVTVPAMTASTSVPVTITTDGGTSNALTFTFG